jgi:hypothetical protein
VKSEQTPVLDPRDATAVLRELLARRPGYVPDWQPTKGSSADALLHVYGRLIETVITRLNRAPNKNKLAFLDMLGISLIPAQSARAPVVFELTPGSGDGRAAPSKAPANWCSRPRPPLPWPELP